MVSISIPSISSRWPRLAARAACASTTRHAAATSCARRWRWTGRCWSRPSSIRSRRRCRPRSPPSSAAISRSRWRRVRSTVCRSASPSAATWSRNSASRKALWAWVAGSPKRSAVSSRAAAAASAPSASRKTTTMAVAEGFAPSWSPARTRAAPTRAQRREAEGLVAELSRRIAGEVRFDRGSRALYATDLSIYRQVPIGVVIPKSAEDVEATLEACRARGVPILGRGCGTSLSGQTCNVAVVLDFSKYMNRILALDPDGRRARVEPGVINDELRGAARRYGLTFAPDPATHKYCTIGGNIGNNSCGVHTVLGGKTVDNVEELEVLTYDGLRLRVGATSDEQFDLILRGGGRRAEIYRALSALRDRYGDEIRRRYPDIPRRVSGYNLDDLLPEKGFHIARALVGS